MKRIRTAVIGCGKVGHFHAQAYRRIAKSELTACCAATRSPRAEGFAKQYDIPHFDLDDIQWDNSAADYGVKRPPDERAALLQEILSRPDWIIEGVYHKWVRQSFEDADLIYVLDMPRRVYKTRIILRSIRRKLGLEPGKRETLKSVCDLLSWTDTFQSRNLAEIRDMLRPYGGKVVWLRGRREVQKIIGA